MLTTRRSSREGFTSTMPTVCPYFSLHFFPHLTFRLAMPVFPPVPLHISVPVRLFQNSTIIFKSIYLGNNIQKDIFRFTFYWSLILYFPLYALSGSYAVLTIVAAPAPTVVAKSSVPAETSVPELGEQQVHAHRSRSWPWTRFSIRRSRVHLPPHMHRTRALYALIVLLTYLSAGLLGAVLGSAVLGYVAAALFKAGRFDMSTCVVSHYSIAAPSEFYFICRIWTKLS